jgi:hypothetical protein
MLIKYTILPLYTTIHVQLNELPPILQFKGIIVLFINLLIEFRYYDHKVLGDEEF